MKEVTGTALTRRLQAIFADPKRTKSGASGLLAELRKEGVTAKTSEISAWLKGNEDASQRYPTARRAALANKSRTIDVSTPNVLQHADILFLPDVRGYKYALVVVDAASRYKAARPLKTKSAQAVLAALQDIYKRTPLTWPSSVAVDDGSEFRGVVAKAFEAHDTSVRVAEPGDHSAQAFAEAANRVIGERIFGLQSQTSRVFDWPAKLQDIVDNLNGSVTRMTGMEPEKAVEKKEVPQPAAGSQLTKADKKRAARPEEVLKEGTRVRVLLDDSTQARDAEGKRLAGRRRRTDQTFSRAIFKVAEIRLVPGRPVEYRLVDEKGGAASTWWVTRQALLVV